MKQKILDTLSDTISNFLYYDRKEDDDLPVWEIEKSIKSWIISEDDLINLFKENLRDSINNY